VSRTRVAHVILARPHPTRLVLPFVWDAAAALAGRDEIALEVLVPVPMRTARRASSWARRLRGASAWPEDIEQRLAALEPRPTLVPYLPVPRRSIEMAARAVSACLARRPADARPHVVHGSLLDEGGYVAVEAARAIGARSIAVAHGTDVRAALGALPARGRRRRARHAAQHAARLVAVSNHLAAELRRLGRDADVIRFSVPRDRFPLARSSPSRPQVLFVGRISRDKGVDVLLRAFAQLARNDLTLRLVGPGAGDLDPVREAARLGIATRVLVDPEMPQAELAQVYAEASCTVLPSLHEGFGIVLVESLLVGRPVVGTDVGGIREIVTPDVGGLVPPGDPTALAAAIASVLSRSFDPERLRAHALPMTWEDNVERLATITRNDAP
jgi:teichuronic acid biosynthesis glycosyltransferase TuaC